MLTLTLQTVTAVLKLGFVIAAGIVYTSSRSPTRTAEAWRMTAWLFGVSAVCGLVHSFWAIAAVRAGAGSPVYEGLMLWIPGMNYGRSFISITWAGVVLALPLLMMWSHSARRTVYLAVAIAALSVGLLAGYLEGGFENHVHVHRIAFVDLVLMAVIASSLLIVLVKRTLDPWLWLSMVVYTFRQPVNALVWSVAGWLVVPEAWQPPLWLPSAVGTVTWTAMIALALWCAYVIRRGHAVHAMFDAPTTGPFRSGLSPRRLDDPPAARR